MEIYTPKGNAKEYSPLALNYFTGCDHRCNYCYVDPLKSRWDKNYNHSQVFNPNTTDLIRLEKSAKKFKGCDQQILLSFTGDPYCGPESGETRLILEILNHYNHKVAILTKNPKKALRDIEVIKAFGDRTKVGTTLTFDNDIDSKEWESGAILPQQRINALKKFADFGIPTWGSFEPVVVPQQSLNLLSKVSGFIDHVRIGKLNRHKGIDKQVDWSKFLDDAVKIARSAGMDDRFYIKKGLQKFNNGTYLSANEIDENWLNL